MRSALQIAGQLIVSRVKRHSYQIVQEGTLQWLHRALDAENVVGKDPGLDHQNPSDSAGDPLPPSGAPIELLMEGYSQEDRDRKCGSRPVGAHGARVNQKRNRGEYGNQA